MKYCKKHDQPYMDFLSDCPVCRGETMTVCGTGVRAPVGPLGEVNIPFKALIDKYEDVPFKAVSQKHNVICVSPKDAHDAVRGVIVPRSTIKIRIRL